MRNTTTRMGKHKEGKTVLGCYATQENKALAIMTADALNTTITEVLLDGLRYKARVAGITDELDRIKPEFKAAYKALCEMCIVKTNERKKK